MIRFACVLMVTIALFPAAAWAQGSATPSADPSKAIPAPVPAPESGRPHVPSFQKGSGAGGPANELNTNDGRASERPPGGSVVGAASGEIYHGNHCGVGTKGASLAPVDELDAACQRHDRCFDTRGRQSCSCNDRLRQEALQAAELTHLSREVRSRALSVAQAAGAMACNTP